MIRSVTVSVAGTRLALRTDAKPSYVEALAAYVTDKIDEAGRGGRAVSTHQACLLAALSLADELHQARDGHTRLKAQVRERSERILHYLDLEAGA